MLVTLTFSEDWNHISIFTIQLKYKSNESPWENSYSFSGIANFITNSVPEPLFNSSLPSSWSTRIAINWKPRVSESSRINRI